MKKSLLRSAGAVFAGIFANFVIAVPIDIVLHVTGIFPPMEVPMSDPLLALASSYRILAAIIGGYLTARFAPGKPMKHVWILGSIGVVMSTAGMIAMWDKGSHWYPILLIVISIPCSLAGGKLYLRRNSSESGGL